MKNITLTELLEYYKCDIDAENQMALAVFDEPIYIESTLIGWIKYWRKYSADNKFTIIYNKRK